MADFAPTATPRYTARYVAKGRTHSMTFRCARGSTSAAIIAAGQQGAFQLANAMASLLPVDFSWLSAVYAFEDSEMTFPAALPSAVTGAVALASLSSQDSITSLTFPARGTGGSKYRVSIYSPNFDPDSLTPGPASDFVVTKAESGQVNAAFDALAAITALRAIDNTALLWGNRATLKVNDYWLRRLRQGA